MDAVLSADVWFVGRGDAFRERKRKKKKTFLTSGL